MKLLEKKSHKLFILQLLVEILNPWKNHRKLSSRIFRRIFKNNLEKSQKKYLNKIYRTNEEDLDQNLVKIDGLKSWSYLTDLAKIQQDATVLFRCRYGRLP